MAVGIACASAQAGPALAQTVKLTPGIGTELTWTNNVNLDPDNARISDLVFSITPSLRIDWETPRTKLSGYLAAPINLYARTGAENNDVFPQANVLGTWTVVQDFFFVDASAFVQQTYYNPFGPRPTDLTNATDNRVTSQSYTVSPYIRGDNGTISYLLRDDNQWITVDNAQGGNDFQYTNHLFGTIERAPLPWGWGADIDRNRYRFDTQGGTQLLELARLRAIYQPSSIWRFTGSVGYEHNEFPLTDYSGMTYGVGFRWRPAPTTALDAAFEHRFFGTSYLVNFNHRTPLSAWAFNASRNISTYPQQLATVPAGTFIPGVLNEILRARIPDPVERAQFIVNFMDQRNLPVVLAEPVTLYSQRITLNQNATATAGLLGARNSVFVSVSRYQTNPITASGEELPPLPGSIDSNVQWGAGAVWNYQLTPNSSLATSFAYSYTQAEAPATDTSTQYTARMVLTRTIGPNTRGYAGLRWQQFDSDVSSNYSEFAVFLGLTHTFN